MGYVNTYAVVEIFVVVCSRPVGPWTCSVAHIHKKVFGEVPLGQLLRNKLDEAPQLGSGYSYGITLEGRASRLRVGV